MRGVTHSLVPVAERAVRELQRYEPEDRIWQCCWEDSPPAYTVMGICNV